MRKCFISSLILIFIVLPLLSEQKLSDEHKNWLDTVSPIITKKEKEVFLKLKTEEERNRFIQVFWKQRDFLPDTSENEFYQEYMKRVQFADANFGRQTSKRGSQTDRGYFYLLLGPPLERQFFTTSSRLLPLELWYYRGEQEFGLPPYFYLIFYQHQGLGEYRLYYPGVEGPEKLVIPSLHSQSLNRDSAFRIIREISAELANVSLSYLPGEKTLGMASFTSDTIISDVHSLPEKKFSDTYVRSYLDYKDFVETEYTHNFMESGFKVKVFKNFNQFFIHWAVEPKKVNFAFYEGKYYAAFQLILRVEDNLGNPILEKDEEIPLRITPEQYKKHERQAFSFQDVLPIISGNYKLFFLLKNKTSKDFTSFKTEVFVPQERGASFLSNLLLYHSRERLNESQRNKLKAFAFGENQYLIDTQNNFFSQKEMSLYCQVYGLKEKADESLLIEVFSFNNVDSPVLSLKKSLSEVQSQDGVGIDINPLSLTSLKPGYYRVKVSLLDSNGSEFLSERENFILLSRQYPVIPWVYSRLHNPFPDAEQLYTLGSQYYMTGNYERARAFLEQSLKMKDAPQIRILLAKSLFALRQFQDSLTLVSPVYQATQEREAAKIIALNYASLSDWSSALVYLEKLMEQAAEVSVLNLAAECYLNLNQPKKALPLLQKSLRLNPNQDYIKELERKTKKQLED
ncbi:MAG: GWxTD domain-containing protein [Candidatus Aminicenantaceae bacterium]